MPLDPAGTPSRGGIQGAIDEAVETAFGDTDWIGLTHAGTSGTVRYRRLGGVVYVEASVTISIPANSTITVVTAANGLPAGFRPTLALWQSIVRLNNNQGGHVARQSDGSITVVNPSASAATSAQFAYCYALGI